MRHAYLALADAGLVRTIAPRGTVVLRASAQPRTATPDEDVVTRFLPDAFDLGMVAAGLIPEATCDEALDATRTLLVRLAACGVIHPDLNVKNVLLTRDPRRSLRALVIDVDVIRLDRARAPQATMMANIARLSRSMRKWRTHFGCNVTEAMLSAFAREAMASTPSQSVP